VPARTWWIWAGVQRVARAVVVVRVNSEAEDRGRWGGHSESLRRSSWRCCRGRAESRSGWSMVRWTWEPSAVALPPGIRSGGGQARCRLMTVDGAEAP